MQGQAQGQYHTGLPVRCEAWVFHPHFISADSKLLRPKNTLLVSRYGAQLTRERISYRNLHAGHVSAPWRANSSINRIWFWYALFKTRAKSQSEDCLYLNVWTVRWTRRQGSQ